MPGMPKKEPDHRTDDRADRGVLAGPDPLRAVGGGDQVDHVGGSGKEPEKNDRNPPHSLKSVDGSGNEQSEEHEERAGQDGNEYSDDTDPNHQDCEEPEECWIHGLAVPACSAGSS